MIAAVDLRNVRRDGMRTEYRVAGPHEYDEMWDRIGMNMASNAHTHPQSQQADRTKGAASDSKPYRRHLVLACAARG